MIGTNKIILNNDSIAQAVEIYLNEHVTTKAVTVTKVEQVYQNSGYEWHATIEPKEGEK